MSLQFGKNALMRTATRARALSPASMMECQRYYQAAASQLVVLSHFGNDKQEQHQLWALSTAATMFLAMLSSSTWSSTKCDAQATEFQVMAALEAKEELEKVRLAQLIHDLHELAKQQTAEGDGGPKQGRLRRYVTTVRNTIRKPPPRKLTSSLMGAYQIQQDGAITANFQETPVTPDVAYSFIQALRVGGKLTRQSLMSLIAASKQALLDEPTLIDLTSLNDYTVTVVGDLHGSLQSLSSILRLIGTRTLPNKKQILVFNGDFVDRGHESLEVLCILLLLKLAHPQQVVLIRGNHEDDLIASVYGFRDEVRFKYGDKPAEPIWEALIDMFTALPLAAKTKTAAILHGGLPSQQPFALSQIEQISTQDRTNMKSLAVLNDDNVVHTMVQEILWSDPDSRLAERVVPNPRGCGVRFGPRVARDFLERHNLNYLVRGHEPVEEGAQVMNCGHGRQVVTVFSAAAYPGGKGTNCGAIVNFKPDGSHETVTFSPDATEELRRADTAGGGTQRKLRKLIAGNQRKLQTAFVKASPGGLLSKEAWAQIMADELELSDLPWLSIQPTLAPTEEQNDMIDWKTFLERNAASRLDKAGINEGQVESLHSNHVMLATVFKFLDVDKSGSISIAEFRKGVNLLNKHLPVDRALKDPEALFKYLDVEGNGEIDLQEFERLFTVI